MAVVMASTGRRMASSFLFLKQKRTITITRESPPSSPSFTDPALQWGREHPAIAELCLTPPPCTDHYDMDTTITSPSWSHLQSLDDYWKWRQWEFPVEDPKHAQALVSHVLSAPLTLAQFYRPLLATTSRNIQHRWCCVGARAEATLPLHFWKELLVAVTTHQKEQEESLALAIDFVGPEIPFPKKNQRPHTQTIAHGPHTLELTWLYNGYLHTLPAMKQDWTAFVLLNPGLGHSHLTEHWKPTVELLLGGERNAPVLLTAHSELDAQRDHALLKEEYGLDTPSSFDLNPFASRITYEDPFDKSHVVQPNHSIMCIMD